MAEHYIGEEFAELAKRMTKRQLRNVLKSATRAVAKRVRGVAVANLRSSGLRVKGNRADWERGVRSYVYPKGGGFLVTVKPHKGKTGKEVGMHANRRFDKTGERLPILMWAEDGTGRRKTKSKTDWKGRPRKLHSTGVMPAKHFIEDGKPRMERIVQEDMGKAVEVAIGKMARKAGLV